MELKAGYLIGEGFKKVWKQRVQTFVLNFRWKGSRENGAGGNAIHLLMRMNPSRSKIIDGEREDRQLVEPPPKADDKGWA